MSLRVCVVFLALCGAVMCAPCISFADESVPVADPQKTAKVFRGVQDQPVVASLASKLTLGFGVCMIALLGGVAVAKRCGLVDAKVGNRTMKVIERLAITPKSSLCLVEINGRRCVIAVGSERVSVVSSSESNLTKSEVSFEDLVCESDDLVSAC